MVDSFTAQGALFTGLDVSNVVKSTLPDVRHRQIAPVVRELFERGAMGDYTQTLIDVLADGHKPAQAYHLPEYDASLYDDAHRTQLAIPPVSTSVAVDDGSLSSHSAEAPVVVGRDGRGRVPRQLFLNAGIVGDVVYVEASQAPARVRCTTPTGMEDDDEMGAALEYEHPVALAHPAAVYGRVCAQHQGGGEGVQRPGRARRGSLSAALPCPKPLQTTSTPRPESAGHEHEQHDAR